MSTTALKRAADGVEAAKRKYSDERPRESIEPMLDMIRKARSKTPDPDQFDVVEKLHTTPDELWAGVKGDKRAFRNELIRRVRDLQLFDTLVSQWSATRYAKFNEPRTDVEKKAARLEKQAKKLRLTAEIDAARAKGRARFRAAKVAIAKMRFGGRDILDLTWREAEQYGGWFTSIFALAPRSVKLDDTLRGAGITHDQLAKLHDAPEK